MSSDEEEQFRVQVVGTILDARTEEALQMLCKHYHVSVPRLGVGVVEGRTKGVAAVYSLEKKEILAANREYLYNPFVIVHEFYHHLRSVSGKHRGTERQADEFANGFIDSYRNAMAKANALRQMGWSLTGTAAKKGRG